MKTPIDNVSLGAGATVALLNSGVDFQMVDLYTLTLSGGTVLRWSAAAVPITFNGNTWALGPAIGRGKISSKLGVEVATLDMDIAANPTDLLNGAPLIPFIRGSGLDGASIKLETGYLATWTYPYVVTGTTISFSGRVTSIKKLSRTKVTLTVSSWLVLLNIKSNPNLYQSPCGNTLYDSACGLSQAAYQHSGATTGTGSVTAFNTNLTSADGTFTQGYIVFTSGLNNGQRRAVSTYVAASGALTLAFPLPFAPVAGDTFTISDGCDLTMSRCSSHFNNLIHFRGEPFIPPPETLL